MKFVVFLYMVRKNKTQGKNGLRLTDSEVDIVLDELQEEISEIVNEKKFEMPLFLKWVISLVLVLMILGWLVPSYYIKSNPSPTYAPSLDEVFNLENNISFDNIKNNYANLSKKSQYIALIDDGTLNVKVYADRVTSLACDYGENYHICQTKALYYFVRDQFDYVSDPIAYDYIKSPLESLYSRGGDCDDAAVLLASMLEAVGIRTRLVFVPRHVYVEAYLVDAPSWYKSYKGQNWITLDATCKNCKFSENSLQNIKFDKEYLDGY